MDLKNIIQDYSSEIRKVLNSYGIDEVNEHQLLKLHQEHGDKIIEQITNEINGGESEFLAGAFNKIKSALKKVKNIDTSKLEEKAGFLKRLFSKGQEGQQEVKPAPKVADNKTNDVILYAGIGVVTLFLFVVIYIKFLK